MVCQAIETKINCSCGVTVDDYEAWVTHVREGVPQPVRLRKPNYKAQQQERIKLLEYIQRHRIVELPNLSTEENCNNGNIRECVGDS